MQYPYSPQSPEPWKGAGGGEELWKKNPSVREELLFSGTTRCTNILGAESFTVSNREH